jgi:hypothetical protein
MTLYKMVTECSKPFEGIFDARFEIGVRGLDTIVEEDAFSGNVATDYSDCALTRTLQEERCKNTSFENFSRYFGHIYSKNVKFKGGKMFKPLSSASGQLALHATIFRGSHS